MHRYGCYATVFMTKSFVRTSLASFLESKRGENGDDFARLQNRYGRHLVSGDQDDL